MLKYFLYKFNKLTLIHDKDDYIKVFKENEFFDNTIIISFRNKITSFDLALPYPVNVHKLTSKINSENVILQNFNMLDLKSIVHEDYCYEKQAGLDLQAEIKKDNLVIILNHSHFMKHVIVNGNHRIISAINDNLVNVVLV